MKNERGVALAVALMAMSLITGLSSVYILRVVQEKTMASFEVGSAKAIYAAEAGGNDGLLTLSNLINYYMLNTVSATNSSVVASKASACVTSSSLCPNGSIELLLTYVKNGTTSLMAQSGSEAVYSGTTTTLDNGTYVYTIRVGSQGTPSLVTPNVWDFPYYFRIQVAALNAGQAKKTTLNGNFTVRVQKDNFARYALFTSHQTMPNGTTVWFNARTNFTGPLFTGEQFSFAYNPSGTFNGTVKQVLQQARYYNNNNPVLLDADANGSRDVPTFTSGFQRGVAAVTMPTSTVETDMANQASGGTAYSTNGIYVPASGSALAGGIYVYGDASVNMGTDSQDRQTISIVQGSTTKVVTIDRTANQTLVTQGGATTTYTGLPDGVDNIGTIMYVNGNITSLGGVIQRDNQMTISTKDDIVIKNNITYENYTSDSGTPGEDSYVPPSAAGTNNLLGLLSWHGDVRISSTAPQDVNVHATIMSKEGQVTVDNYDTVSPRGTATILGGVITNYYGAFGTFNSTSGAAVSGFGRNFVYDTRMETEMTPPYYPVMNTFVALTRNLADKLTWQQGGF